MISNNCLKLSETLNISNSHRQKSSSKNYNSRHENAETCTLAKAIFGLNNHCFTTNIPFHYVDKSFAQFHF